MTAKGAGTATITVRSNENSSIYKTCTVTVYPNTYGNYSTTITQTPVLPEVQEVINERDALFGTATAYEHEVHGQEYMLLKGVIGSGVEAAKLDDNYSLAAEWLQHFLASSGTAKTDFPVKAFLSNTNSTQYSYFKSEMDAIMAAAENMVISGTNRTLQRTSERTHISENATRITENNYHFTLGSYRFWTRATVSRSGNSYSATVTYGIRDYYDFDPNSDYQFTLGSFLSVATSNLYQLHRYGYSRNFNTSGEATIQLTWLAGQRSNTGAVILIP